MNYLLFAGDNYYPQGGLYDLIGVFETVEDAKARVTSQDWAHIVKRDTLFTVSQYQRPTACIESWKNGTPQQQAQYDRMQKMNETRGWRDES